MSKDTENNIDLYLKIIEYKRSIGTTQWTVLSIFITASEAVLALGLSQGDRSIILLCGFLGIAIYWFGFLLYNRYRGLNKSVSEYLVILEKENGFSFQQYLDSHFHDKGLTTNQLLIIGGLVYLIIAVVIAIAHP